MPLRHGESPTVVHTGMRMIIATAHVSVSIKLHSATATTFPTSRYVIMPAYSKYLGYTNSLADDFGFAAALGAMRVG